MSAIAADRSRVQKALSALGVTFSIYMFYATLYGPYITGVVHLALLLMVMLAIFYLDQPTTRSGLAHASDWLWAGLSVLSAGFVVLNYEHVLGLWGAPFMTKWDLVMGTILVLVVLEAGRRTSFAFFLLALLGIAYILYGAYMPGILKHSGMEFSRFIYLTAFTAEGIFGAGLDVAASYLFMFMLLSAALDSTKTGKFLMDLSNAGFGHMIGGPAKSAVVASAALGTMVGSAIGNVVTTGAFTIPLMIRYGFRPHIAAAIETVGSEGSQFLPPVMGAGAFIMAEFTGIPYATIALAAVIPAVLYYVSLFAVVHIESIRMKLTGLPKDELPSAWQAFRDGWHLLVAPLLLVYLLLIRGYSPNYAGMFCLLAAVVFAMFRHMTRLRMSDILSILDRGTRQTAQITALIAGIGLLQQAMLTTGLGPRLTEVILVFSDGSTLGTLVLGVVIATVLGMGMPTPIAYILLALFVAPAVEQTGVPTLAAHLFLFYFAIKSGSTPPVAMVAVVAASIAKANWWRTGVTSFNYSIPGFIVAFMFIYSPELLMQGPPLQIVLGAVTAFIGVLAIAGGLQGWWVDWVTWFERILLVAGAVLLVKSGWITDLAGLACVGAVTLYRGLSAWRRARSAAVSAITVDSIRTQTKENSP